MIQFLGLLVLMLLIVGVPFVAGAMAATIGGIGIYILFGLMALSFHLFMAHLTKDL